MAIFQQPKGRRLVIVDLGPGKAERLARLRRLDPERKRLKLRGADLDRFSSGWAELPADRPESVRKDIKKESFLEHLKKYRDGSVDLVNSDMALGYYTGEGKLHTSLGNKNFDSESLGHLREVAKVTFEKLKPTLPSILGRKVPTKKYFVLRLQGKQNVARVKEILEEVGFKVNHRLLTPKEQLITEYLRNLADLKDVVFQINAYKPARTE